MGSVQGEPPRTVTVRLVSSPGPIRGQVADEQGSVTDFDGWLELTAALEEARNTVGGDEQAKQHPE